MSKAPLPHSMHDLHQCYSSNGNRRWIATPRTNIPYAIARRVKQTLEIDKKYPKGTFFVITDNGKKPDFIK